MEPTPKMFSVVVPFRDEGMYLEQCIRALQDQKFDRDRYELIFVDNGSSDDSVDVVGRFTDVVLLQESRADPYLARNRGIEAARGEYIAFTDADCRVEPDWLKELAAEIQKYDAAIVVGRLAYPPHSSGALDCYSRYYDAKCEMIFNEGPRDCLFGHGGNMAVKTSLFDAFGLFEPMPIVGDSEFIHRAIASCPEATIAYAPAAVVSHVEVSTWRHCLQKVFRYGTYSQVLLRRSRYRPLTLSEKLEVVRRYSRASEHRLRDTVNLVFALFTGWAAFQAGRLRVRLGG